MYKEVLEYTRKSFNIPRPRVNPLIYCTKKSLNIYQEIL